MTVWITGGLVVWALIDVAVIGVLSRVNRDR